MIRRLGLWGGCQGRGKSLGSLILKPRTHPYLQVDLRGSQDLRTKLADEQAAGQHSGISGKSVPARRRGGHSVPNVGGSRAANASKSDLLLLKTKQNACPEGDVVPNAASRGPDQLNRPCLNLTGQGLNPKEPSRYPPFPSQRGSSASRS